MTTLPRLTRRLLLTGPAAAVVLGSCARAAPARDVVVYKTPWCGCCGGWVTHMRRAGFRLTVEEVQDLTPVRARYGVPFELSSCHTAVVGGYVVEGHVPPADVERLLRERPKGLGITVPGMPLGSPGMETRTGEGEAFQTLLLLDAKGQTRVFATHGSK